ncbi:MAG: DUF6786 family protein [Draconibacterium sp.]
MRKHFNLYFSGLILFSLIFSCTSNQKSKPTETMKTFEKGTYGYDLQFLQKHKKPLELKNRDARILISPEYQGRVMTSTANGDTGKSYGWINHDLIASGEEKQHINAVGGEERFWLGPEGGQFSIYFKPGAKFDFENWQTPTCIDTDTFDVVNANDTVAEFTKQVKINNYSNFTFDFYINRKISLLNVSQIKSELNLNFPEGVKCVGYQTVNSLTNTGTGAWKKETGLLSIWLLGMFIPSDEVTLVIPYKKEAVSDYIVKDDYFGKIPADRLVVKDGFAFLKGDGKQRGKIGIPPQRVAPVMGSYDAANKMLTIVKCQVFEGVTDYVNSAWELQQFPFKGDAVNAYNDGPVADGTQMGPFYELESSSPALALQPGEKATYKQSTFHFEGTEEELNAVCRQVLGVSIEEIKAVF